MSILSMLSGRVDIFVPKRFNFYNFIIRSIESGRLLSSEYDKSSVSKLTRFPIELGIHFSSRHKKSRAFKCVNFLMLDGSVKINVSNRYNSSKFVRALIESRRFLSSEPHQLIISKLMKFPIELGSDFTSLHDRSSAIKCVNFLCYLEGLRFLF